MTRDNPASVVRLTSTEAADWYNDTHGTHFPKSTWPTGAYCEPCDQLVAMADAPNPG